MASPASDDRRSPLPHLLASAASALRREALKRTDRRLIVFRWTDPGTTPRWYDPPIELLHTTHLGDVPASAFADRDLQGLTRDWYRGFFAQGAELWTALKGGRALGSLWAIDRARLPGWYLPTEAETTILYGVVTPRRARGRGIAANLALAAARDAHGRGHAVYLDCKAWNHPAHRAFAKAGFAPVAVVGSRFRAPRILDHG